MNKLPPIIGAAVLVAATAGITWWVFHTRLPDQSSLDKSFYGLVVKSVSIYDQGQFERALDRVKEADPNKTRASYRFWLVPTPGASPIPYTHGREIKVDNDTGITTESATEAKTDGQQPRWAALTHKLYSIDPRDIAGVAQQIKPE